MRLVFRRILGVFLSSFCALLFDGFGWIGRVGQCVLWEGLRRGELRGVDSPIGGKSPSRQASSKLELNLSTVDDDPDNFRLEDCFRVGFVGHD